MDDERKRKLEELLLQADALYTAQKRLSRLVRQGKIAIDDFRVAKLKLVTIHDRVEVEISMIHDDFPVINAPTDEEVVALRAKTEQVEQQILAAQTTENLINLVNTILGETDANA